MSRGQEIHDFKIVTSSYLPEVKLDKSDQKAENKCVYKCQRSKRPEVEVAIGQSRRRLKGSEVEMGKGRRGQSVKWPEA